MKFDVRSEGMTYHSSKNLCSAKRWLERYQRSIPNKKFIIVKDYGKVDE